MPVQLLRLGSLFIASVPSEFTTMAGRRLRSAIQTALVDEGLYESTNDITVVIAGLANRYAHTHARTYTNTCHPHTPHSQLILAADTHHSNTNVYR